MTTIAPSRTIPTGFWPQINHQLRRIETETADTFDAVRAILLDSSYRDIVADVNANGERSFDEGSAFFAGPGGDESLHAALRRADWHVRHYRSPLHYSLVNGHTGQNLTYIEGDVIRGDQLAHTQLKPKESIS